MGKALVYLQVVYVKLLKIRQRRIARAEIIKRYLDARFVEKQQLVLHAGFLIKQQPFGDFNDYALSRQPKLHQISRPCLTRKAAAVELYGRHVHADLEFRSV